MSLFAAAKGRARSRRDLKTALAGNLCRCTGYGPILAAGEAVVAASGEDQFDASAKQTLARLKSLDDREILEVETGCAETGTRAAGGKRHFSPRSLTDLDELLAHFPKALITAGLTDVGLWVTKQGRTLETVISLSRVTELRRVTENGDGLELAAGVTLSQAAPYLGLLSPDLGELLRRFASAQIRNSATVCGNIANGSPIGDLPPAFIALDAELILRLNGQRRRLGLADFYIAYGRQDRAPNELVEAVRVPRPGPGWQFRCYKISKRFEQDISAVMAAFAVHIEDGKVVQIRLAFGGMAGVPARAAGAEAALTGRPFTEESVKAAMAALASDFTPLDDMRASAVYRLAVAQNLVLKFFHEVTGPELTISVPGLKKPVEGVVHG